MKEPDDALGRVLAALRRQDVPTGFEDRLMSAVRIHATAQPSSRWRSVAEPVGTGSSAKRLLYCCLSGLGSAVLIACLVAGPKLAIYPHMAQSEATSRPAESARKVSPVAVRRHVALPPTRVLKVKQRSVRKRRFLSHDEQLALSEAEAPSKAAPPLPLTRQEKLLLRVARFSNAQQLAVLSSTLRDGGEIFGQSDFLHQ